jgi:hypothetical protein
VSSKHSHSLFFVWAMEERSVFQASSFSILCLSMEECSVFQYLWLGGRMFWTYHIYFCFDDTELKCDDV